MNNVLSGPLGFIGAVLLAYLLGSISFAVLSSRLFGLADPRSYGSGNPGATNVLRSGHKGAALFTLIGDALKGLVAVLLARWAVERLGLDDALPALCALAAFIGHCFPLFHGFKGGKGVATAAGVLFGLNLGLGLATLVAWLLVFGFFRISSVAALVAAAAAVVYQVIVFGFGLQALAVLVMGGLLVWRHQDNIRRLLAGQEGRVAAGKRKPR